LKCDEAFENMACDVLSIFDSSMNEFMTSILLLQKIPYYNGLDCLQMAVEGECLKFVSQNSVQNLLTDLWNGKITGSKSGFFYYFKVRFILN
jgi:hypothetical protein